METAGARALVLNAAVAPFAPPVEEHGPRTRVAGLALLQPGVNATAPCDGLQPVQRQ
jgi:hypothetical protein